MSGAMDSFGAIRIFFTGVGGQGALLATRFVGEAASEEGLPVMISEIHGMAQRGGVVESSVVVGQACSPTIADGEADILMAFEPLEALRALSKCHSKSLVIASNVPILPFPVAIGQKTYPQFETLNDFIQTRIERLIWVDTSKIDQAGGSERAANIILAGVLAGTGKLPVSMNSWQKALKKIIPAGFLETNRIAFKSGFTYATREKFVSGSHGGTSTTLLLEKTDFYSLYSKRFR